MDQILKRSEDRARWLCRDVRLTGVQAEEVVRLSGKVNFECFMETRKTLLKAVARKHMVIVDLSKVTHIDSSGLTCLVEALQMARNHGADLALFSVSTQVKQILKIARLHPVFPIENKCYVEQNQ